MEVWMKGRGEMIIEVWVCLSKNNRQDRRDTHDDGWGGDEWVKALLWWWEDDVNLAGDYCVCVPSVWCSRLVLPRGRDSMAPQGPPRTTPHLLRPPLLSSLFLCLAPPFLSCLSAPVPVWAAAFTMPPTSLSDSLVWTSWAVHLVVVVMGGGRPGRGEGRVGGQGEGEAARERHGPWGWHPG